MSKQCAGCRSSITRKDFLTCIKCKDNYDLLCANLTPKKFNSMSQENKNNWTCQACRNKIPKCDNTNTPISSRYGTQNQTEINPSCPEISNVTYRSKNIEHEHRSVRDEYINTSDSQELECTKSPISDVIKNEIRYVVRNELSSFLSNFETKIFEILESRNKDLLQQVEQLTNSLNFFEQKYEEIRQDIKFKSECIKDLESKNNELKCTVSDLSARLTQMEQHSRASNVEIQCIPEHKSENLVTIIKQIASITNYKLNESDIHLCTRVSKLNKSNPRPRSVLVKFSSPIVRDGFLAATLSFNKKNKNKLDKLNTSHIGISGDKTPIYVMEHLSPAMKALHAATRIQAKAKNYRYVWIKSGRIYVRKNESSEHKLIKNQDSVDKLE
nr:uncharacterized protein LOC113395998 [Vanessa tameamea]